MTKVTSRKWFNRIDETVVLGALPFRGMTKWLYNEENVRGVVTLNEDWELEDFSNSEEEWKAYGIDLLKLPTIDFTGTPTQTDIEKAVDFILGHRVKKMSVYVHCKAGRTRSATVVACYLVKLHGWTPEQAVEFVQEKRPHIWLRDKQWDSIKQYYNAFENKKTGSGG